MKRIALLSDTHGHLPPNIFPYFESCDEIWHGGDIGSMEVADKLSAIKPLRAVHGNIDNVKLQSRFPEDLWLDVEGMKIFMTHITGSPGKFNARVKKLLLERKPNVLICGHSHLLKVMHDKEFNVLYMNPGAAGNEGFHQIKTLLRFTIDKGVMKDLEVVELGKRGSTFVS